MRMRRMLRPVQSFEAAKIARHAKFLPSDLGNALLSPVGFEQTNHLQHQAVQRDRPSVDRPRVGEGNVRRASSS